MRLGKASSVLKKRETSIVSVSLLRIVNRKVVIMSGTDRRHTDGQRVGNLKHNPFF